MIVWSIMFLVLYDSFYDTSCKNRWNLTSMDNFHPVLPLSLIWIQHKLPSQHRYLRSRDILANRLMYTYVNRLIFSRRLRIEEAIMLLFVPRGTYRNQMASKAYQTFLINSNLGMLDILESSSHYFSITFLNTRFPSEPHTFDYLRISKAFRWPLSDKSLRSANFCQVPKSLKRQCGASMNRAYWRILACFKKNDNQWIFLYLR